MTRNDVNVAANALLDVLPDDGMPEGYAVAAIETAGITPGTEVVALLIAVGLLDRADGPRIVPGAKWAVAQAGLAAHRAALAGR